MHEQCFEGCCGAGLNSLKELRKEEIQCFRDCIHTFLHVPKSDSKLQKQAGKADEFMERFL